jgi:hypothetical protein
MSDFEAFNPGEGGEAYDPAAFERFKDAMKKSGAFIAAARKGEQKQKVKEDKLAKILLKFIQSNQKSGILMLAARLLEENIPASFILSIIVLCSPEIRLEIEKETAMLLKAGEGQAEKQGPADPKPTEFSLMAKFEDSSLPLKIKAEIDDWGKNIFETGSAIPFRVIETCSDNEGHVKKVVIDCLANVLDDYLAENGMKDVAFDTCFSFCEFLIRGIMNALQKQIENQKELGGSK